jgi:DNA polymerase III subunit delta'
MGRLRLIELEGHPVLKWTDQVRLNNKIPHALCFSGVDYGEKMKVAMVLAQDLLCERPEPNACGDCGSCRRIEKNQSEFLLVVEPEKDQIKIAEAKRILDFLSLSTNGRPRVVILNQAHLLNANSANRILKTIEEPHAEVFFVLLTVDEKNLMPTIKSRVQIVRFQPENLDAIVQKRYPKNEEELSQASADLMYLFWTDDGFLQSDVWREHVKDRERMVKIVRYWISLGRDSMMADHDHRGIATPFEKWNQFIRSHMEKKFKMVFLEFLNALVKMESEIHRNIDSALLMESLWIKFADRGRYA